jgi:serine/threonine-protein kinase RsbW
MVVNTMNILRLSIPPLPRFAGTARYAFSKFAGFHRLTAADAENLVFALGEAVANAIQHAASGNAIEVRVRLEAGAIVATIRDRGRGFAAPARGPVALPSLLAETGRGFAIMQRCTDFLDVHSKPGKGTVVTLGRYLRERQELTPAS